MYPMSNHGDNYYPDNISVDSVILRVNFMALRWEIYLPPTILARIKFTSDGAIVFKNGKF